MPRLDHPGSPVAAREGDAGSRLRSLDGLRFLAAFLVVGGHYVVTFIHPSSQVLASLTGLGMTLFFVLSGFVIHYTYHASINDPGGARQFVIARFARLYPLFIVLFVVEFAYALLRSRGACGLAGERPELFLALPLYLTLTQTWLFGIICHNSLVYQYGPISQVSWSISVEVFFYLAYLAAARCVDLRAMSGRAVIGAAVASYLAVVGYFLLSSALQPGLDRIGASLFGREASSLHNYQDSLLRWFLYFFPPARLPEFVAGIAAAHIFLLRRHEVPRRSGAITVVAVLGVVLVHFWFYGAVESALVKRIASPLYAPLVAVMLYVIARDAKTVPALVLGSPLLGVLGEASYSIYLLHELLPGYVVPFVSSRLGLPLATLQGAAAWGLWWAALLALLPLSLLSYRYIEKPARASIRQRWA